MKRDALVVGINQYPFLKDNPKNPALHLQTPAPDAEAIAHLLETRGDFEVHRLPAKEGVKQVDRKKSLKTADLQAAIRQLFCPQGNSIPDTALLFFAGHGLRRNQDGETEGFLATSEASPRKNFWGISLKWLRQVLQESPVRQQIIWLDCCHSGELLNFTESELGEYQKGRDRCLIVASRDFQVAYGDGEHGMLTNALLQSLDPANRPDGWVTNFTLVDRVRELLKAAPQHPVCTNTGGQINLTGKNGVLANICPYKGLAYFDWNEEDPKYFYGRTRLTKLLLEKVRSGNLLAVLGASGSGKSSVVRAGLLYQLQLGEAIPGSDGWKIYPPFTPGDRPLQRLKEVVGVEAEQLEPLIKAAAAERVVLVVDQFEEVFTQCRDDKERQEFFKSLLETLERTENKLCLVLVMRSDFFGKCTEQEYSGLANKIQEHLVTVMPMNRQELEEAITKPAQRVDLEVERELVTQMIADIEGSPGQLPLAEYTLTELWQQRTLNRLTVSEYTRLGGIDRTLEKRANEVYQSLSLEEQQVAKRIFLELTLPGDATEDTRRQIFQQDLVNSQQSEALVKCVLQRLVDAKLVITGEQELGGERVAVVNIAHETLIRRWSLLRQWVNEIRDALIIKQAIEVAAKKWRDEDNSEDYLLQGLRLAEAENFLQTYIKHIPVSSFTQEFIEQSLIHDQIKTLLTSSQILLNLNKVFDALIKILKAGKLLQKRVAIKPNTQIRVLTILQQAVYGVRECNRLEAHKGDVLSVSFSPDNQTIVSASSDGTIKLWRVDGSLFKSIEILQKAYGNIIPKSISFSPNGQLIALAGADGIIRLWRCDGKFLGILWEYQPKNHINDTANLKNQLLKAQIEGQSQLQYTSTHGSLYGRARFSPNNQFLVLCRDNGTILFWSLDGILLKTFKAHDAAVTDIAFSYDERVFVTSGRDNTAKIWNRSGKLLKTLKGHKSSVTGIAISPDGSTIASASDDGIVKLWNQDGTLIQSLLIGNLVQSINTSLSFSPNGQILATSGSDNIIRLWNLDGSLFQTLEGHSSVVTEISFSSDGQMLASASADKSVRLWNINGYGPTTIRNYSSPVNSVSFSPDGQTIATNDFDTINLCNRDGVLLKKLKIDISTEYVQDNSIPIHSVRFSPDGKIIAASCSKRLFIFSKDGVLLKTLNSQGFSSNPFHECDDGSVAGIRSVNFSSDGQYIISANDFAQVRLRTLDGTLLQLLQCDSIPTKVIFYSNKAILIATVKGDLILWDIDSVYSRLRTSRIDSLLKKIIDWGKSLVISKKSIYAKPLKNTILLGRHKSPVLDLCFNHNKGILASASVDKTVKLWSLDGKLLQTLKGHSDRVLSVSFQPNGKLLVSTGSDGKILLWNCSGRLITQFQRTSQTQETSGIGISFELNPRKLDTQSELSNLFFDIAGKSYLRAYLPKEIPENFTTNGITANGIKIINISPNSPAQKTGLKVGDTILAIDGKSTVEMNPVEAIDTIRGKPGTKINLQIYRLGKGSFEISIFREKLKSPLIIYNKVRFSPDGLKIATSSSGGIIQLWSYDGKEHLTVGEHYPSVNEISFSPDGQTLATAGGDKTIKLWSINGHLLKTLEGHTDEVRDVNFSPDGDTLISSSLDNTIKIWKLNGQEIQTFEDPSFSEAMAEGFSAREKIVSDLLEVNFSHDSRTIACTCIDGTVQLWDQNGNFIQALQNSSSFFSQIGAVMLNYSCVSSFKTQSVSFSPNNNILAYTDVNNTINLYKIDDNSLAVLQGHSSPVNNVTFSPDGQTIATASTDRTIRLWDYHGNLLATLIGHTDSVWDVQFSPDSQIIASASLDKTVRLWTSNGTELGVLRRHKDSVFELSFSPDGKILASSSNDKTVILWSFDLNSLLLHGYNWVSNYIKNNPNVSEEDRSFWEG